MDVDDRHLRRLTDLVRDFSGLEIPDNRRPGLERIVASAVVDHGVAGPRELCDLLAHPAHAPALEEFAASLTIGETHFFRNAPQLDALRTAVLPELIDRRAPERRLRIWSAGCSTGEEAYSLAMLVDILLPRRDGWDVLILATDINRAALERARRGVYGPWSFRQVPDHITRRYFTRRGREYHLSPAIRDAVTFGYLNLAEDAYPSAASNTAAMDLVLCRNVLIYFREETVNRVVARLHACLAPGGWLVAGHAESPMPVFRERLTPREFPMAVLYQAGGGGPAGTPAEVSAGSRDRAAPPVAEPPAAEAEPSAPAPTRSGDDGEAADALAAADALWRSGRVDDALRMLQDRADRDPRDARPLHLAAKVLASALRLDDAEHTVRLALGREPLGADLHYLHGLILQELDRRPEALEALRRAAYLAPDGPLAHYALASLLAADGQVGRAERSLDMTIELVSGRPRDELVDGGDGVTFGRLLELARVQRQLIGQEAPR